MIIDDDFDSTVDNDLLNLDDIPELEVDDDIDFDIDISDID